MKERFHLNHREAMTFDNMKKESQFVRVSKLVLPRGNMQTESDVAAERNQKTQRHTENVSVKQQNVPPSKTDSIYLC